MTAAFALIPLVTLCLIVLALWGAVLWAFIIGYEDALIWALVAIVVTVGAGYFIWACIDAGVISP